MRVCFETFGCRLNRAEALQREAQFIASGWTTTASHADADLIVVRGCSVTSRAQRDCEHVIAHIRRKYPNKRIVVEGCLPEAKKPQPFLPASLSETDAVPVSTARAYLKIQDGCNGACTFCIVPQFRGKSVSVPFDAVMDKARRFIESGYHEIVITGCNAAQYLDGGARLPRLVASLAELGAQNADAPCRIRLGSVEPGAIASEIVDVMSANPNVCRYLHLPVQSGSTRTLSAMKRPYTIHDVESIVRKARELMPDVAIACDLMTGFPGESEVDMIATLGVMRRLRFSKAHVFPYSERPDTPAVKMPHSVPREVRRERAHQVAAEADAERGRFARSFAGKTVEMVVEDERHIAGWSSQYLWCVANPDGGANAHILTAKRKSLVKMRVTSVSGHMLLGDVV